MKKITSETITIDSVAQGGDGVGRLADGRVVFVPRVLPGEEVTVKLTRQKKSFARGVVERLVRPSAQRVDPDCPFFRRGCGGCQFWHTDYEHELARKAQAARETLERLGGLRLDAPAVHPAPAPTYYRNRVTYHLRRERTGAAPQIGFFAEGSHELVAVDHCRISEPPLNEARRLLEPALRDLDEAEIVLETSAEDAVVATVRPARPVRRLDALKRRFEELVAAHPAVEGIVLDDGRSRLAVGVDTIPAALALADAPPAADGHGSGDGDTRLPAARFRQVNDAVNRALARAVHAAVGGGVDAGSDLAVLELFCGAGNFSFALRDVASTLIGVEGDAEAVRLASELAERAGLGGYRFVTADLFEGFADAIDTPLERFDVVLLDPPRKGAARACAQIVEADWRGRIVYVACDAACLARDLATLTEAGWRLTSLEFFDMFPRTAHIETLAILER